MNTVPDRYNLHITYHLTWGISTPTTALDTAPEISQTVSQPTVAPTTPLQAVTRPAETGTQAAKEDQGHSDHTARGGSPPLHRLHAFPSNRTKAGYVENTAGSQRAILNIVNASYYLPDDMASAVLSRLAQYIAPDSPSYITRHCEGAVNEFKENMRGFFIWVKASTQGSKAEDDETVAFAVIFCICSGEKYRAIDLAKALLDFVKGNSTDETPEMVSLCYEFIVGGVMGVMFFEGTLEKQYSLVLEKALEHATGYDMYDDHPVTLYPSGRAIRVAENSYKAVFNGTKSLCSEGHADMQKVSII